MHVIAAAQDSFLKYGLVVTAVDEDKELMRLHRRLPHTPVLVLKPGDEGAGVHRERRRLELNTSSRASSAPRLAVARAR